MKNPNNSQDKSQDSAKSLKKSFTSGVGVPIYTVLDDDRSADYESAQFQDDWSDWTPNSWGY